MTDDPRNASPRPTSPLAVERVIVRNDRIVVFVRLASTSMARTTPTLIERVLAIRPDIARHACVNSKGPTFASVMRCTSIPHLLEHLAIDFQVEADTGDGLDAGRSCKPATYVGVTHWVSEREGKACVELSYTDDIVALKAISKAVALLNDALLVD